MVCTLIGRNFWHNFQVKKIVGVLHRRSHCEIWRSRESAFSLLKENLLEEISFIGNTSLTRNSLSLMSTALLVVILFYIYTNTYKLNLFIISHRSADISLEQYLFSLAALFYRLSLFVLFSGAFSRVFWEDSSTALAQVLSLAFTCSES